MGEEPLLHNEEADLPDRLGAAARRHARRAGRLAMAFGGEAVAAVTALVILTAYMGNTLLTRQSTDLDAFRPAVKRVIAESFDGVDASFDTLNLRWFPSRDSLVFTARGVNVTAADGTVVQQLDLLRAGLHMDGLRVRRPDLRNLEIEGGEVTWLERADRSITAGLGGTESVGRYGPVYRGVATTPPAQGRDWLESFETLRIRNSRVNVINESNGLSVRLNVARMDAVRDGDAISLDGEGRALAQDTDEHYGDVALTLRSPDRLQTVSIDGTVKDMRLDRVAPVQGRFAVLRGAALPISARGSGVYSAADGLEALRLEVQAASGYVQVAGEPRGVRSARIAASLDPGEQVVTMEEVALASDRLSFSGKGVLRSLGRLYDGDVGTSPTFDLSIAKADMDLRPRLQGPLSLRDVRAVGQLDLDARSLALDTLAASLDDTRLSMRAKVVTRPGGLSELELEGDTDGAMSAPQLLALWPLQFADGARRWIDRAVLDGRVDKLAFAVDLDPDFFAEPSLNPDRLRVDFSVSNGTVRYIETMTPLSGAAASGRIVGNSLELDLAGGRIGDVRVQSGRVEIPQLMPKGGDIRITADASGRTSDLLALADQPPFGYLQRYGVDAEGFGGTGQLRLTVTRPLLEFFDQSQIRYGVDGRFEDASAPFEMGGFRLTNADVKFRGGPDGLFLEGPADLGPWRAQVAWEERYGLNGAPTVYRVTGRLDQSDLDAFGLGSRQILGGTVGVSLNATGQGMDVREGSLALDLTDAELSLATLWNKPAGLPGRAVAALRRDEDGYSLNDVAVLAPELEVTGSLLLRPDFALSNAQFDMVRVEGVIDGSALLTRSVLDGAPVLGVDATGRWLDISSVVGRTLRREPPGPAVPLDVSAEFDAIGITDDYRIEDAVLTYSNPGDAVTAMVISGSRPTGPLTASVVSREKGREASLRVPDLEAALRAAYGVESVRGGRLSLDATLPPAGEEGAVIGRVTMDDFTVADAPFLAQLLSLASLTGLFDTLAGDGLAFNSAEADFSLRDRRLALRDARMSGPALGMTAEGRIDFGASALDLEGALVPAYTANSLLSDLPLIGDIFTDKDGEGLFALTYTATGPFERTQVAVNPLSALTPGFLRGIFRSDRGDLPDGVDTELAETIKELRPPVSGD